MAIRARLPGGQTIYLQASSEGWGHPELQVMAPEDVDWRSIADFMEEVRIQAPERHDPRPSVDYIFMQIAELIRERSTCVRGKVGVVATQGRRIVATGYNGAPPGAPHCTDLGCDTLENDHNLGCQRTIHAEANVVAWAARAGTSLEGATIYSTHSPCLKCAQLLVSTGIGKFYFNRPYRLGRSDILIDAGLEVIDMGQIGRDLNGKPIS